MKNKVNWWNSGSESVVRPRRNRWSVDSQVRGSESRSLEGVLLHRTGWKCHICKFKTLLSINALIGNGYRDLFTNGQISSLDAA